MSSIHKQQQAAPFIVQLVGYKNTGKTTSVCRLTEKYKREGLRVGTIKHDAHDFQIDTPGTDTWQHQAAGADITAITSSTRTAILKQTNTELDTLIASMQQEVDIILIEGFKSASYPKIVFAREVSHYALLQAVSHPIALVCWPEALATTGNEITCTTRSLATEPTVPVIPIHEDEALFALLQEHRRGLST
ncbi:molybdopterin-guanine dinucleotide biosynthesis protein B [Paenibacillus paeoniae]|uniref:Molybdopterin-guanine dinucleotide biosynthesis protein B n=1 Tax=Paenibacillus paeoniae TaxID=2292705 RepID=A0A371PJ05_9BACL|nr:molybdopterin-guanine dinucleotide biosynthesis protein B [Paenibacillus paeoniae]REK75619.1 molybdopterin-guanine dinucleotide biosynthesis protein B [Paenibacillus paeoniae]